MCLINGKINSDFINALYCAYMPKFSSVNKENDFKRKNFLLMLEKLIGLNLLKPAGRLRNESFGFFYDKITLIQKLILLLVCLIPNLETSCGLGPHP